MDIPAFGFRFRFSLPQGRVINHASREVSLHIGTTDVVVSLSGLTPHKELPSEEWPGLILVGEKWPTANQAFDAAVRYRNLLMRCLVKNCHGVDYHIGEAMDSRNRDELHPLTGNVEDDQQGLIIYKLPRPEFQRHTAECAIGNRFDRVVEDFERVASNDTVLEASFAADEALACELYNASFFEVSQRTQLLLRIMAVEALCHPQPRSPRAREIVDAAIAQARSSNTLGKDETNSLVGTLNHVLNESISRTCKLLVENYLPEHEYDGTPAARFFARCYDLRSRVVHSIGEVPSSQEIANANAWLLRFVADLLSARSG